MEKENIFDYIFEKKFDYDLFDMDDTELNELDKKMTLNSSKLFDYVESSTYNKQRKKILRLIVNNTDAITEYYYRQSKLYYKNGFIDGINLMLSVILANNNGKDNF